MLFNYTPTNDETIVLLSGDWRRKAEMDSTQTEPKRQTERRLLYPDAETSSRLAWLTKCIQPWYKTLLGWIALFYMDDNGRDAHNKTT